jgi:dTDP-4-amino-4,6-dideoxygalactose transaminase
MNAMKVFAACGDAGFVTTDRADVAERLIALRYNGTVNRETCIEPSLNGRLDTLQAAILLRRLPHVPGIIERRREIAAWYSERLAPMVTVPREVDGERDACYTFQVQTDRRDELKAWLEERGIETRIQHPVLMPDQPAYRDGARGEFTRARAIVQRILCLPAHEKLVDADLEYVADAIETFATART